MYGGGPVCGSVCVLAVYWFAAVCDRGCMCFCVCVTVCFANKLQKYFKGSHNHVALKSSLESATLSLPPPPSLQLRKLVNEMKEKKQEPGKTRQEKTSEQQAAQLA